MRRSSLSSAMSVAVCLATALAHADEAVLVDKVVAVVGHTTILRSDVLATMNAMPQKPKDASGLERVEKEILDLLIDNVLIVSDALRRGIRVSDLEVAQAKERVAQAVGREREERLHDPSRGGLPLREFDAVVRAEILKEKWLVLVVKPRVKVRATPEMMMDPDGPYARGLVAERAGAVAELRKSAFVQLR